MITDTKNRSIESHKPIDEKKKNSLLAVCSVEIIFSYIYYNKSKKYMIFAMIIIFIRMNNNARQLLRGQRSQFLQILSPVMN